MRDPRPEPEDLSWAAEQMPRLLEEARADALEEVRARLRDRLVDALLSSVAAAVVPSAPAAEPVAAGGLALWVYGVADGDAAQPPELRGVDPAHPVGLIRHGGLAAIVSQVPLDTFGERALRESLEDLDRLEVLARTHEHVLDETLRRGAVVPFRICTIFENAAGVQEMLARERDHLTAALRRLTGMAEWGVKAYAVDRPETEEPSAAPVSGSDYLSRKLADRDAAESSRQAVDAIVESVHDRLRERAADAVLSPPQTGPLAGHDGEMVLNAAYLVADSGADRFGELVAELAGRVGEDGLRLELTGPWPAYHFGDGAPA
jgi:hypothetical protein